MCPIIALSLLLYTYVQRVSNACLVGGYVKAVAFLSSFAVSSQAPVEVEDELKV